MRSVCIASVILCSLAGTSASAQSPQERLWNAAVNGDTATIRSAVAAGARMDSLDHRVSVSGRYALNWAAWFNHPPAIDLLLKLGAEIDAANTTGFTPLHHAAENGSLEAARALLQAGARVRAHDPVANAGVAARFPRAVETGQLRLDGSPYEVTDGADALVLVTEWKQFRQPNFERIRGLMRMPVIFDGRNLYEPEQLVEAGFVYRGIGRPQRGHCKATAA